MITFSVSDENTLSDELNIMPWETIVIDDGNASEIHPSQILNGQP